MAFVTGSNPWGDPRIIAQMEGIWTVTSAGVVEVPYSPEPKPIVRKSLQENPWKFDEKQAGL
jgi:hypothetical protein